MSSIRRIKHKLRDLISETTPIRHGHVYMDKVTGERFEIESVGRWVELQRFDAERRAENRVKKETMREAIANGHVEHLRAICPEC